jgi:hypothetical protein
MATLRAQLKPITSEALESMKELMLQKFHEACAELLDLYRQRNALLKESPDKIEPFAAHVDTFMKIKEESECSAVQCSAVQCSGVDCWVGITRAHYLRAVLCCAVLCCAVLCCAVAMMCGVGPGAVVRWCGGAVACRQSVGGQVP